MKHHGSYDMRIVAAGGETAVEFDGTAAELGWNRIGDYDLPAGEVRVVVSNQTSGDYCVADAASANHGRDSAKFI